MSTSTTRPTGVTVKVKVGQVWQDCDKRMKGRFVVVTHVLDGVAWVSPDDGTGRRHSSMGMRNVGRPSKISIRRMYPHSTGFKLIKDVP